MYNVNNLIPNFEFYANIHSCASSWIGKWVNLRHSNTAMTAGKIYHYVGT